MTEVIMILSIVFGTIYFLLILTYTIGWFSMKYFYPDKPVRITTKCSIIVPARNEEANIIGLLEDLKQQTVDRRLFEIIIVDDNSNDNTVGVIEDFIRQNRMIGVRIIVQEESKIQTPFKKKAIQRGIEVSTGDLIITTDADCRLGNRWLETMLAYYEKYKPAMMVGPVSFHNESTFFEKMQTPEFLSLIAITAGAIQVRNPIMCNGANLGYERKAFENAGGYGNDKFSSGDDVFLMLRIKRLAGRHPIRFVKNFNAIAFTEGQKSLKEFYHQRTRWASKNKGYDLNILFVSFTVYMVNLLLAAGWVAMLFNTALLPFVLGFTVVKALIDIPVIIGISNFVNRKNLLLYALPLGILYPFYIIITGAMGIIGSYRWKDRKLKH